jgi:hypothetical protein
LSEYRGQTREREIASRGSEMNDGWGKKKGKNNFLGNREAVDFQIDKMSYEIDSMLNK